MLAKYCDEFAGVCVKHEVFILSLSVYFIHRTPHVCTLYFACTLTEFVRLGQAPALISAFIVAILPNFAAMCSAVLSSCVEEACSSHVRAVDIATQVQTIVNKGNSCCHTVQY